MTPNSRICSAFHKVSRNLHFLIILSVVAVFYWWALGLYFVLDDWWLFGPSAASSFLGNPLSVFQPYSFLFHYSPVTRLWNDLLSVAFGTNPLPYHAGNLLLLAVVGILLCRLFRVYGFSALSALLAALYFTTAVSHLDVVLYLTTSSYLWLSIFFILALHSLELFLSQGNRKYLLHAFLFMILGQYTHTIALAIPVVLAVRMFLFRKGTMWAPARDTARDRALATAALFVGGIISQLFPRVFFGGQMTEFSFHPRLGEVLHKIYFSLTQNIWKAATGGHSINPPKITPYVLGLILALLVVSWFFQRRHWRLMLLGLVLSFTAWFIPAYILGGGSYNFAIKFRYMIIPNLGISLALAGLLDAGAGFSANWIRKGHAGLVLLFFALLLIQAKLSNADFQNTLSGQDAYLRKVADTYRRSLQNVLKATACEKVVIFDVPLGETMPPNLKGNLHIQNTSHETIHDFFFSSMPLVNDRVRFERARKDHVILGRDCTYLASAGTLRPLK